MNWPDFTNGLFESIGGLLLWANVRALYRDKVVRGVRILPVVFWSAWGFWNLYYYPSLDQWWSFAGGLGVVIPNTLWVLMAVRYTRRERASRQPRAAEREF